METYQEWKKRRTEEGTIGQRTTAPSSSWSSKKRTETGAETYTAWKERRATEGTLPDYKRRLFENTAYNRQNQLFDYLDRASAFYRSAKDDFDSTTWGNAADTFKTRRTDALNLRDEGLQLQSWMQENKDYLDPEMYDQVYSHLMDINGGYMDVVSSFRKNADFYGQFATEDDYLKWDAYSTPEKRQATYQQNMDRLEVLREERRTIQGRVNTYRAGTNPYASGGSSAITGMDYGAANQNQSSSTLPDYKSDIQKLDAIDKEINALEEEISMSEDYERSARYADYMQKYSGKSYNELLSLLPDIKDEEEREWVSQYAPSVMTVLDYNSSIENAAAEIDSLEKVINEYNIITSGYGLGGEEEDKKINSEATKFLNSHGFRNIKEAEIRLEELKTTQWDLSNRKKYAFLDTNQDFDTIAGDIADSRTAGFGIGFGTNWWGFGDPVYDYINDIDGTRKEYVDTSDVQHPYTIYDMMYDDEIMKYNYLYNTEGKDSADKYLDYLEYTLNERRMGIARENAAILANKHPFAASALSVPYNLVSGIGFADIARQNLLKNIAEGLTGEYIPVDYNSGAMGATVFNSTVRGTVAQNIANKHGVIELDKQAPPILSKVFNGKSLGDVYQLGMSMADSATTALLAPVIGTGATALLGGSAASQGVLDAVSRGATDEQALMMGIVNGACEMFFEKYSLEQLLKGDTRNIVMAFLKQGFAEGSEEFNTTVANNLADIFIMAKNSNYQRNVDKYIDQGLSPEEAEKMAFWDAAIQAGWDFVGGFASGGIMGSVSTPIQNYQNQNAEAFRIYGADPGALVSEALEIDPDNAYAQKMQNRLEAGKQLSGGQLNRLVKQNEAALYAQDIYTIQSAAEAILTDLGETGDVSSIAAALAKQAAGRKLTRAEQKVIANSKYGQLVANEMNTEWVENIGTNRINAQEYNRPAEAAQLPQKAVKNTGYSKMLSPKSTPVEAPAETVPANRDSADDIDGMESTYAVSEDGKAHLISNPEQSVDIVGFDSVKNGKAMLRTSDGEVVPADDVSYANESQAIVFETIANMGIKAKSANILLQGFRGKEGIDAEAYARGLLEAFEYGKANRNTSSMSFSSALTPAQLDYVYRQGRKAAKKHTGREQARVIQTVERARAVIDQRGDAANAEYTVILEDGLTEEEMTPSQKASYEMIRHIPAAMKGNVRIYDGKTGEFGYYDPKSGDIYLNINSTRSQKSMMAFAMGHELVHRAKDGSPAKYQKFADFLIEQYGKQGSDVEAMIAEQKQAAKDHGLELTDEQAFDEVVADACQRMLLDTNAGQRLAEFGVQSKQNQSIVQDVIQWIRDILEKLRNIFADVDPDSLAAQEFAKFDAGVKQILADMYVDMTIDAGENLSVIKKAFGSNTQVKTNENGEFTMAQNKDGSRKIFNLATWENGGKETLEATLRREGYTQDEIDAALKIMDAKQEMVTKIANELDGNGRLAFPEQGRINEATLTTDIKDGHAVLSALVSNGDYPVNIDLLMVCKKRKAYQRVINRLCETGMIKQATVDTLAIAEINKILGKYGFETACLGCFVESRRLRIQEWAQTIVKEWNGEVKKRDHNAKPFGFGKGEAKLTPDEVMQLIGELETSGPKNDKGNLNLGQGSAVKRMGVLLDKVPSLRRTLTVEDLITPEGLSSLRQFDSNLFSMVKSRYGSNSPKFVQEFNPYNHELAKYGKVPSQYKNLREYLYAIGGARMQSFSDFIVENWFDYCQIVADLAARKLPMHTYTKEIAMVKLFGMTGIKINMSLIPDVDRSLGKEYAGLTRNAQGELELIWADKDRNKATGGQSYMQSINAREAFELQNDPRYSANIGTIAIGISDRQIRMMLNDSRIRMVIPYHASGMNPIFADMMGTSFYKDYTNVQNTTIKQIYNSKGQPATLKLSKPQVAQLTGGFQFNEVLQEKGDARAAADAYKAWCSDASLHTITIKGETYTAELTPKFNDFADEANYYKLLEDFNTYDCITEQAAPQGDVQQIYPEGFEAILRAELSGQERYRQKQEKNQAFDKAMAEIESYLSKHTKADTVYYAQQQNIKLSKKDSKLDEAGKARLKELQDEGARFSLPKPRNFSYQELTVKSDLQGKVINSSQQVKMTATGLVDEEWLVDIIKTKCDSVRTKSSEPTYYVNVPDIDRNVEITRKGIHHGLIRNKLTLSGKVPDAVLVNARAMINLPEILANSIEVNRSQRGANIDVPFTRVMMGVTGIENVSGIDEYYAVRIMVEERANQNPILVEANVLGKLYAVNAKKISNPHAQVTPKGVALTTDRLFSYSVADMLNDVKTVFDNTFSVDVYQKMNTSRKVDDFSSHLLYKLPVTEDTSPRALLTRALDSVITDPVEKQKLQEYRENIEKMNEQEAKLRNLKSQIKDLSFAPGPRDTQKIKALREEAAKTENRINLYDKRLLRFEASSTLQKVLRRERDKVRTREQAKTKEAVEAMRQSEREKYQQRIDAIKDRHKATKAKMTETRAKREATAKLRDLVLDTARWIDRPKKGEIKVPDVLKKPYADFLNSIDLSSQQLAAGGDPTNSDLRLANAMSSLATTVERITAGQDPTKGKDTALDSGYLDLPADFVQRLRDMTMSITAMMDTGDHAVNAMSAQEVKELSKMIRTLNHAIREVSTLYANMRFANVQELGRESMEFMDGLGEIDTTRDSADFIVWDNALPFYAFKRFGAGGESVFEGLMDAQDKLAFLSQEIFDFQKKTWNEKDAKAWSEDTHTIQLPSGNSLTLTTADAMSIYCLSRRRQGLQHLLGGGVRVIGIQKGSKKAKDSRTNLTMEAIDAIVDSLDSRQKKVAEAIQEFMSSTCAEWGNEISMKRFLTREFTEEHYFPIESNTENMTTQDPTAQQSDLFRLLNISATKALTPNANNEVIIRNVFDVFTGHASDMARLNAFGMPLLDYMKWLNYREKTINDQGQIDVKGVRKSMEKAYGNAAKQYVMNLIKDVNGRTSDGGDPTPLMKWMRSAKTASVGNSLRVATLQMTSYPRASLVLSSRNLALGLSKKPNIEKAKKYCGIALWKSFGFYDTNISRSIEEQMKGITDPKQKLIEWSLKGAEIGDALTWGYLWNACEYEVAATKKYKVGSEEFNEAVGKKLREVVYRTQVVDSTLTRSQLMRSKRGMAQEAAAFMSEPTLSANILMDAGFEFNMEKRRSGSAKVAWEKTGKYIGKAIAVYSIGQLTAALLESLWDAWRDDDDEKFVEKYLAAFRENLILDILPFNKIPIVSDVFEAVLSMAGIGFYSSDRMTTTWITNAVSAVDAWKDYFGGESNVTAYGAIFKSVKALSSYYGVSGSGFLREGVALWNNTAGAYDSTLKIRQRTLSKSQLGGEYLDAVIAGNDRQAETIAGQFVTNEEREKAIRAAIKSRFTSGEIGELDAAKYLILYGGLDASDAHWNIEKWVFDMSNETGEAYHKYDDFLNAVKSGENLDAVIDEYLQNGVSRTDLRKQITNGIRPEYIDATEEEREKLRDNLLAAMQACGYTEADAESTIGEWDFEAEYGFDYSERRTAYLSGELDEDILKKALVEYGGYDPKDAEIQVQAYDWEAEGYENVSTAAVKNYSEYCAASNVPKDIYMHIRKFANSTENDVVNGEKVPYSAVKKIMREINSQTGLTSAQKTAIARSIGWKDSTIEKYKLW